MTDEDGFRVEAALQYGFDQEGGDVSDPYYIGKESQMIAFAKACEMAGLSKAATLARRDAAYAAAIELECMAYNLGAEIAPIREAAEFEFMTAQGYVRATDEQPGARWIKVDQSDAAGADFIERRAEKMNHDV